MLSLTSVEDFDRTYHVSTVYITWEHVMCIALVGYLVLENYLAVDFLTSVRKTLILIWH